jgi:hypothetical protein
MADLDELRRLLRDREALAPDPDGIASAARAHGTRMRRRRLAGAVVASAAAVVVVVTLATTVGLPRADRAPTGGTLGATPTSPVDGGWPAVPLYTVPVVPGSPEVPGPTSGPTAPVSGRAIDPVVPFSATLPAGWREADWSYEEGSFRATFQGPESNAELAVVEVLDPASQPASLLRPSGDLATAAPGPDGSLAWRADSRHFVRLRLQGAPVEVLGAIVDTLRFTERPMVAPFTLRYLPPGLHLSGARITFRPPDQDMGQSPWFVSLAFDYGTGATTTPSHDLSIDVVGILDRSSPGTLRGPTTVVAGRTAAVRRVPEQKATAIDVAGVVGQGASFVIGDQARGRIPDDQVDRMLTGLTVASDEDDQAYWLPLRLP